MDNSVLNIAMLELAYALRGLRKQLQQATELLEEASAIFDINPGDAAKASATSRKIGEE